jgi:NAD(P)H-dependent FMN reductase
VLEARIAETGADVTRFDLGTLPMFGTVERGESRSVLAFQEAVTSAAIVVWVVPTYHNEMPGSAKNALDHLDPGFMNGRLSAVVGVASGSSFPGAVKLAACLRFLGGRLPLNDVFIGDIRNKWSPEVADPPDEIVERMAALAGQLTEAIAAGP